jgi:hypothetical protein
VLRRESNEGEEVEEGLEKHDWLGWFGVGRGREGDRLMGVVVVAVVQSTR